MLTPRSLRFMRWRAPAQTSFAALRTISPRWRDSRTIVPRSPVPLVADVHFQFRLALAALDAGVACLRLNPGNIRKPDQIRAVASEARDRGVPIRIGVNGGSLDPDIEARYGMTPTALVESAKRELAYFEQVGFDDVKISVKASNVRLMIESYRLLADTVDFPLHLGVTEAGPPPAGLVKSTAGIATLLNEGIGDTIPLQPHGRSSPGSRRGAATARVPGFARAHRHRPCRMSLLRPCGGRRHRRRPGCSGSLQRTGPAGFSLR